MCFDKAVKALDDLQENNLTTFEEFKAHGMAVVDPMIKEFKKLFLNHKCDYPLLVAVFMVTWVLNPLCAVNMDTETMIDVIKSLHLFGFNDFLSRLGIIEDLTKELLVYCVIVTSNHETFWSQVEGADACDTKLVKQVKA